jgi:phosphatidylserine/phosphatidylglycerophosphate/cardiolipin synthase-like enzyme
MKKLTFSLLLFLGIINLSFSQVIPIDSVRKLDANGVPILVGQHVLVKGVVTTHQELGIPLVYFQVPTAGLCAYDATFGNGVTRGDSIIVSGLVTNYSGLIELQPVDSFRVLAQNVTTPVPIKIIPTQARSGELWESRLIRIDSITMVKTTAGVQATTWSTSSSGTNYWIFVGSDSCQIRIYTSSNIAGTTIPAYPFSVVALMSQYTTSPPYNTGYQIIPRDLNDIINTSGGPTITSLPVESNINQTGITLTYTTLSAGDTKVKYFVSDSIGQPVVYTDSVYNPALTTSHTVNLTNLNPGKIYYSLVSSKNANGTSTIVKYFGTQSHTGSTGKMEAYFNYPTEPLVALPNNLANGSANYQTRLIQRIDSASYSIDLAIYSFDDLTSIRQALINAMIRGVKIRVVYDSRTIQSLMQDLINAGIRVQQRNFATSSLMHNKFFVFDGRDQGTSSYSKKWIWSGSANITYQQFYQDIENTIFIQDEALCNAYTREFEEMWGSHNEVNNPTNAKFGTAKTDNTPHIFNVNGKRIECYFSPSDDVSGKIENVIGTQTNYSVNFCIYAFTKFSIENKMHSVYNYPTRMVRGVFDRSTNGNITNGPVYYEMAGLGGTVWNPTAKVFLDNYNVSYLFHDKYILIDAETPSSNPVVMTGSFNFSNAANFDNDENELIIYDSLIANQYYQDFAKRLTDAGGMLDVKKITSEIPVKYMLEQNYPNPFNPSTIIRFSIPKGGNISLKMYDVLGKEVGILINQYQNAGTYEYTLHIDRLQLSSGIYFYTLKAGDYLSTKKMLLVK